jgi:phenylacetate-CoA ligase
MVEDGAVVEMVYTFLDWEGGAFMRYALGDMLEVTTQPCECRFPRVRIKIVGRADDMLIVKGVNVYPEAIKSAILRFHPPVTGQFRILLSQPGPMVRPPLRITLEYGTDMDQSAISELEKKMLSHFKEQLRIAPQLEWVAAGSIPRELKKTKYIEIVDR